MPENTVYLTEKEFALMKLLWASDRPLSSSEILLRRDEHILAARSFHSLINSLLRKNYVKVAGVVTATKVPSRLYAANISASKHTSRLLSECNGEPGTKLSAFLSCFIDENKEQSEQIYNELNIWLNVTK